MMSVPVETARCALGVPALSQYSDARQDVYLALLLSSPPQEVVEDAARLRVWLVGAVRRRVLDRLRRERRRRQVPLIGELATRPDDPDREEASRRVHAVLASMSEGTYSVDPANQGGTVSLWAKQQGPVFGSSVLATKNNGKWTATHSPLATVKYDTWGELVTYDPATKKFNTTVTSTVTVDIK